MNKQKIAIKKLSALVIESLESNPLEKNKAQDTVAMALSLNAEAMNLGFILSQDLLNVISALPVPKIVELAEILIAELRNLKGADVVHKPMYPNFPEQVMEAADLELYSNALMHYWSHGEWLPQFEKSAKPFAFETTKYRVISIADQAAFNAIFTQLLLANDSLSEEDRAIIQWFMSHYPQSELTFPEVIPFQENKCVVAAILLTQNKDIAALVDSATDVLRIATCLSEGDVSLASNTKFISLPRKFRKELAKQLERVISEEDIGRHKNKWKALLHGLHIGDYSKKSYAIASKLRNNEPLDSFYGRLEHSLNVKNVKAAVSLLKSRPGEFARRLDHVLRLAETDKSKKLFVVDAFLSVSNKIPTRILLQLLGHLSRRKVNADKRVVFPKGNTQKAVILRQTIEALNSDLINNLSVGIRDVLNQRFSELDRLGKVWIDPDLRNCPLPSQQRSTSEGLINVARGTRLPIPDAQEKNTLRFFIYWVGKDIDLSATFHHADFSVMKQVSYNRLRLKGFKAFHSGDVTSAPKGASEFIDVTIDGALKKGARYLTMNVLVYNGPTFDKHKECFAGWMMREKPKSNEIFDAKAVEQKIDVRAKSRNVIPVVFDLLERKAIWADISTSSSMFYDGVCVGNNVESNQASIQETLEAVIDAKHKLSLYELFELHAKARGEVVETPEEADTVYSLDKGITPFDINVINSEYII